jgi:hypothetical protein
LWAITEIAGLRASAISHQLTGVAIMEFTTLPVRADDPLV